MTRRHNFHSSNRVARVVAITNVRMPRMVWFGLARIIFHTDSPFCIIGRSRAVFHGQVVKMDD